MTKIKQCLAILICLVTAPAFASNCHGRITNPITDICWSCLFPLSVGAQRVFDNHNPDTDNPSGVLCVCKDGLTPKVGITLGFWEPSRLVDVVREPYCFVGLGGFRLNLGFKTETGTVSNTSTDGHHSSFYQVHWYVYPLLMWLNLITDATCVEQKPFDLAYITELDATWGDDALAFFQNPEAILVASPPAQVACAADCVQSSLKLPDDRLYWCAGCQGSMYPLSGVVRDHISGVQASTLLVERMAFKLHRLGILQKTAGRKAMCGAYTTPFLDKSDFRLQMVYPLPVTHSPKGCNPFGRSTVTWGAGKEYPVKGEDFSYVLWRKRNCCAG